MQEIDKLIAQGEIAAAKQKFRDYSAAEDNPNIERAYIQFLYEHDQYIDFKNSVVTYLNKYPEDTEIKQLEFEYYAKLAADAERIGDYGTAIDYIVKKLLVPEFRDNKRWESRQTTIFRKWYEETKAKGDRVEQERIMTLMRNLGFENLARTIDPEVYDELQQKASGQ